MWNNEIIPGLKRSDDGLNGSENERRFVITNQLTSLEDLVTAGIKRTLRLRSESEVTLRRPRTP